MGVWCKAKGSKIIHLPVSTADLSKVFIESCHFNWIRLLPFDQRELGQFHQFVVMTLVKRRQKCFEHSEPQPAALFRLFSSGAHVCWNCREVVYLFKEGS